MGLKARVKATGEIVEVTSIVDRYVMTHHPHSITFEKDELDFNIEDDPDYWTRLEHKAAIAAMQGLVTHGEVLGSSVQEIARDIAEISCEVAHALVEKYKKEK